MLQIKGFPWAKFFRRLYAVTFDADVFNRAAQTAFYFSFALFPLLFFIISVTGLVLGSTNDLRAEVFAYLRQIMPVMVYDLVRRTIEEVVENSSSTKLVFGLIVALWSASAGIDAVRNALNAIYKLRETRSWWSTKALSILLTLASALLVAVVLSIVFYGWIWTRYLAGMFGLSVSSPWILGGIQWLSILLVMLFACELIYNLLPAFRVRRWTWVTVGSIVAIVSWLILTSGFRVYLSYFNTYDRAYGSLGTVIIMMLWLYLTALVLMVGGVINYVIHSIAREKQIEEAIEHSKAPQKGS